MASAMPRWNAKHVHFDPSPKTNRSSIHSLSRRFGGGAHPLAASPHALAGSLRESVLTESLPRFLWHATASNGEELIVDILFDATDIDSGRYIRRLDVHDPVLEAVLSHIRTTAASTAVGKLVNSMFGKINTAGP